MLESIPPTGLSVIYDPQTCTPVVDIVLVHGLNGHPYKTWTSIPAPEKSTIGHAPEKPDGIDKPAVLATRKNVVQNALSWWKTSPAKPTPKCTDDESSVDSEKGTQDTRPRLFWPGDLLPRDCPNARVFTYGYDSTITKNLHGDTNHNSIYSHGKDFLYALQRQRRFDHPIIFLAHSLGGIVVKEMLARSSTSASAELRNIAESTTSVIFLGTPHRGSPDLSSLGEWARYVFGILGMKTTSTTLDTLGLTTTDLERTQESFSALWNKYEFQVKTFQEGVGLTGMNIGAPGNKLVPHDSSLIGDHRERAETLQANHMEMCQFTGAKDPNYHKVAGELRSICHSVAMLEEKYLHQENDLPCHGSLSRHPVSVNRADLTANEKACLQSLHFLGMNSRYQSIDSPALQTGHWIFKHPTYQDWLFERNYNQPHGLLRLMGKPGAGKSTLMKEAYRQAKLLLAHENCDVAAFFFNAKGGNLEHSPIGLYRSLLYQLLPNHSILLRGASNVWSQKDPANLTWKESELKSLVTSLFSEQFSRRTIIFIDAIEECDDTFTRSQVSFWGDLVRSASGGSAYLSICISSRHFPNISTDNFLEIIVEDYNTDDISTYMDQKFTMSTTSANQKWAVRKLKQNIVDKSAGVFLWAILVADNLLRQWDEGKSLKSLLEQTDVIPQELEMLFAQMIRTSQPKVAKLILQVFQWALWSSDPLTLDEWHHVLAFIKQPGLKSLEEWRHSENYTENDEQLEREIKYLSRGLLKVSTRLLEDPEGDGFEAWSVCDSAESLDHKNRETRVIQIIHESVREFFLEGKGFQILNPKGAKPIMGPNFLSPVGSGHLDIATTCLDYMLISEVGDLIFARKAQRLSGIKLSQFSPQSDQSHESRSRPFDLNSSEGINSYEGISLSLSQPQQSGLNSSISERLQERSEGDRTEIMKWIATSQTSVKPVLLNKSAARISAKGRSKDLPSQPALLSYALSKLFTHLRLAHVGGAHIKPIVSRLRQQTTWARFVALKEHLPPGITLNEYATLWEGLPLGPYYHSSKNSDTVAEV